MVDKESSTSKKWNWNLIWGGGVAIGTLIIAIPIMLSWFKSSEYKITATGDYFDFAIPSFLLNDLEKFDRDLWNTKFGEEFPPVETKDQKDPSAKNTSSVKEEKALKQPPNNSKNILIIHDVASYLYDKYPRDSINKLDNFKAYFQFSIENTGSREVTELKLELPFNGYYSLLRKGEKPKSLLFVNNIEIGSLRPANSVTVVVWTNQIFFTSDVKKARVTYPNGVVDVEYPEKVTGFLAWLGSNSVGLTAAFSALLFMVTLYLIGTLIVFFIRKISEKKQVHLTREIESPLETIEEQKIEVSEEVSPNKTTTKKKSPRRGFLD